MIEQIGNFSLVAVFLVAIAGSISGLAGWRLRDPRLTSAARGALLLTVPLLLIAGVCLLVALASSDMRFAYVASYTERSLPLRFKLVAFWAGQEGSILLWASMLCVMAAVAAVSRRRLNAAGEPVTLGVLNLGNLFFALLLLFAANPFLLVPGGTPADGRGLNPQLQHWAMSIHPPMLFMGYAGFAIPFAIMMGALAAGKDANGWAGQMRRWVIVPWLFLGAGIMLGAWWAYVELGWGGYWAWDPVENASLLPWLTGTALMHTLVIHRQRHSFRVWTACLTAITFVLCVFGTYLTRSGVIESIHAFGQSPVGTFFLVVIVLSSLMSVVAIVWRLPMLRSPARSDSILSRESVFVITNVLLLVMTGATLVGTIFPLISELFVTDPVSVGRTYYDRVMAPLALVLAAVMALGPVLVHGKEAAASVKRGVVRPGIVTAVVLVVAVVLGVRNITALVCVGIASMTVLVVSFSFVKMVRMQMGLNGWGPLGAGVRVLDANHRRYGGHLAHVGVVLLLLGIMGSSLFGVERQISLAAGESVQVGRYTLTYEALRQVRGANYTAIEAQVRLTTASGRTVELTPQNRFFDKAENPSTEVSIRANWREDLYVALIGWENGGETVALRAMVNPLTMWIWIGSAMIIGAGVFSMTPRFLARPAEAGVVPASRPGKARAASVPETVGAH
jgi:cytochrome c-type biogenesis protein CcmF